MAEGPNPRAKWSKYKIDGDKLERAECCPDPRCGPGVFLAIHKDRKSCGKCGYNSNNEEE
ncbi:30S ribosomal protein S27ae [Euryarchaeota archaeon]|jgi:small subunit ribosomal protein S27Ae|nr:30S ribosomal protein S27ae [Euryarchaeota archaeon]MDC0327806.1 30S ribosomal protein S27ae [bacterium]MDC0963288.1 30S ribosomal protein S27ae [Euryarchaeota archaeon]|tara:strand:- start:180 stop:359 length:180 start_codon:yes stop_codon:yes gene_type:complete